MLFAAFWSKCKEGTFKGKFDTGLAKSFD